MLWNAAERRHGDSAHSQRSLERITVCLQICVYLEAHLSVCSCEDKLIVLFYGKIRHFCLLPLAVPCEW